MKAPKLRELRQKDALSMQELAAKAGVGIATVARLETGSDGYPATIRKLAKALGVKPADLMAG